MASARRPAALEVIAKIEDIFENITNSLLREDELTIQLRCKKSQSTTLDELEAELSWKLTYVSFPAKTAQEAWRFTVLLRILELIHEALYSNVVISKRNIYYKDPALFKSQTVVNRHVDILAYTFGVQRADLNVTAAAKGLVAGGFTLMHPDGTMVYRGPEAPHLIDDVSEVQAVDISDKSWILVVEKESTFRTLASSMLHMRSTAGKGIIITAKGYPDLSTRAFLRLLSTSHHPHSPPPPIYALADFDPDGIAITSTYKHGSYNLSHENEELVVPSMRWMGIQSKDVLERNGEECKGLLRLSGRDRKKAVKMLENSEWLKEEGVEREWRRELQVMLMLNVKAEMEVLSERVGGVEGWVEERLLEGCRRFRLLKHIMLAGVSRMV
ncbi:hypothetical protein JMJ35_006818 [Cladonia borealis]|uniref:DNA topoisomerase (ATP-hydrolyzing) n=1 Tax=Cladonia borealis TaxID=184061 RepID=A0AA39U8H4_9LECA|nr:hypothetical protein JMJ35_006818 [Cladonia borealis]